jgi:SAM-dependent methyltransferase
MAQIDQLVCPETKEPLHLQNGYLATGSGKKYPLTADGRVDFLETTVVDGYKRKRDLIDTLKAWAKGLVGKHYMLVVYLLSPVFPRIYWPKLSLFWEYLIDKYTAHLPLVVQVGSGNHRINQKIVNIDIFDFPEVDLIADCTRLPYADGTVDAVLSMTVLEHLEHADLFLAEAYRVLKPGGVILCGAPFIYGFHASPHDYYRWTKAGLQSFHEKAGFHTVELQPMGGPTASLILILQEWLAMLLSLNISLLYYFWLFIFSLALIPFKILDIFLVHHRFASNIASSHVYIGRKP